MRNYKIIILLSYISIASGSAVIINPALPYISTQMSLSSGQVEWLVSIFLIGYVSGQVIYGPIAKKYGEVTTLRIGLLINLVGIVICIFGGYLLSMPVLLIGRLITALGASAGLICTFIILNHSVDHHKAKVALSFAGISFTLSAISAIFIGGMINYYSHWNYCFYVLLIQGVIMLGLSFLYQNSEQEEKSSISISSIVKGYRDALSSVKLVIFSLTLGTVATFSYCYTAAGPFITKQLFNFTSAQFGLYNIITMVGILAGSFISAKVVNLFNPIKILIISLATFLLTFFLLLCIREIGILSALMFFIAAAFMYFTLGFIYPVASHIASNAIADKANAAGATNFINMGLAVIAVSIMGYLPFEYFLRLVVMSCIFPIVCIVLIITFNKFSYQKV
ncbi:MFS transporter [Candidatus Francisella endociliophora]|uniref:MFS transporter n=1 Tax=Candidatus Francisella endociliophora TaxID=653937 RepID=A0A097EQ56_9GAMM|nr:MFS transporter [Francisella sp. FSC1006]AIT09676.1 MFS transporter [Francisella sp. FSC1006]